MSIIRIEEDNIERYTLLANPRYSFASSSSGLTGSLPLFADGSATLKDVYPSAGLYVEANSGSTPSAQNDADVESLRSAVKLAMTGTGGDAAVQQYMNLVNSLQGSTKFSKSQKVIRFEPTVNLNPNFLRKKAVRQSLFPYYRYVYNTAQWSYTNYHTLNFVTGGNLPEQSVIMYPAGTGTYALENQNAYAPSSSFTFDFYINPRYTQEYVGQPISPGTIFHMSSCYALSVVTGTSRGLDGKVDGFRLLLQLSQSAEIPPRNCVISSNTVSAVNSSADPGFLFVSNDNSLKLNNWHHVGVRWGGQTVNGGTGSFVIDGLEQGTFVITSQSCMQANAPELVDLSDPDALFLGNFYEGTNRDTSTIASFFNSTAATREGFTPFGGIIDYENDPVSYSFTHPLNAEIHDVKIFQTYRNDQQLLTSSMKGYPLVLGENPLTGSQDIIFYVPPLFTPNTLPRSVLQTPFQYLDNTVTDDPFNVAMSFGVGGHDLNLENFVKDFVRNTHPRLLNLTASEITVTTNTPQTANYFLYESGSQRKRNITALPCDNGRFKPDYSILLQSGSTDKYVNDFGIVDLSTIGLQNMVSTGSLLSFANMYAVDRSDVTGSYMSGALIVPILENATIEPGVGAGQYLTILQRTGDASSNEVVFFDVSNMFYGDRIKPGSVNLTDLSVTGSAGRVSIKLKDDGYGNLYRADSLTPHAKWASVGNVLYEEGILVVKSPNIPMFGADSWEVSFEGERNIHVYEVNVPAPKGLVNSSTNPTFQPMLPSDYPSETASSFVYVTGIQLHDENLNVVGRANLAQPVIKRDGDRIVFRLRMDY
jgi:hypothetical protein